MKMSSKLTTAGLAAVLVGSLSLSACGSKDDTVHIVGFSVLQAPNDTVIKAFQATDQGKGVKFDTSYGASGAQRDAVINGQKASEVQLSLEPDVTKLVSSGLVDSNWKDNSTDGICTDSVVVIVTRPGNPLGIKTFQDIVDKGAKIVTPNPASSGSAKWNLLAAYGAAMQDGGESAADTYMQKFFNDVVALPDSGKDATSAFESGTGDVLLSYENEAIGAKAGGAELDYVVPPTTLLIQNPCAIVKDAPQAATDFMSFQKSADGQKLYAAAGFRPLPGVDVGDLNVSGANDPTDPFPAPADKLMTIDDDFGGWDSANTKYFDPTNGILTKLQADNTSVTQ